MEKERKVSSVSVSKAGLFSHQCTRTPRFIMTIILTAFMTWWLRDFKMRIYQKVRAITLIVLWWLAPNQTNAQQDSIRSTPLNEVVITATKFPKNVNETAKVLTIIDENQLARSSGKDVSQLLNEQVGLIINGANSNPGKDKGVFLRGAGSAYTLITLDGIPINDPSGVGGAFDLRLLPVDQIERIEILKGSQSTLYGTDAIGGVINIITKKKSDKPLVGAASLSYGSYNTFKGNAGISGSTEKWDYSMGYTRFNTDGISEAKDITNNANFDKDGYSQDAFQANVNYKVSKDFSIKPYFRYNNFNGKYDAGSFTDSKKDVYTSNLINMGFSTQYKISKGEIDILYGYDKTDREFDSDFGIYNYKGRFQHFEAFLKYDLNKKLQLLAGLSHQYIHMLDTSATEKNPTVYITSPYASLFFENKNGFSLEFGGRLNHHSKYGDNLTYSINPSLFLNHRTKLFANVSSGFKTPTLNQLFGQYGANPDLKPEKSQNFEAGIQFFNKGKNLDIRLSAFQRNLADVIFYSFNSVTFESKYINLNTQSDHGFEVEVSSKINSKLTFQVFYAFVDGQVTDKSGVKDTTYHNLFRRPKHSFGFTMSYQATPKIFIQANLKTFSNRSDLYFNSATFVTENVNLDAYALLNLYLEYKLYKDKVKVFLDAKNLLNQDYMEVFGYNTLKFNVMSGLNFRL